LEHQSGLPIRIHSNLFDIPAHKTLLEEVWIRSRETVIAGADARTLSPEDSLLHVVGHASYSRSCHSWRWVTDAWLLLARCGDLNWDHVVDTARRHHMTTAFAIMLDYLFRELNAPIPASSMDRLRTASTPMSSEDCESALWGLVVNGRVRSEDLLQNASGWRERFSILKWLLLPPAEFIRWGEGIRAGWLLPLYYFYRPIRFAVRRTVRTWT
jgi:hypothetical protein